VELAFRLELLLQFGGVESTNEVAGFAVGEAVQSPAKKFIWFPLQ
jgi:hypothetical protein